jgi:hypothetical protein
MSGVTDIGHPAVGHARHALQCRVRAAAAPDRRAAGLAWRHGGLLELEEAAVVRDRFAHPQLAQHCKALRQACAALLHRHAADPVLLGELAADADTDTEHEPCAMPYLFASLKVAITLAFIGSVISETVGGNNGIGFLMLSAGARNDAPTNFPGLFAIAIMGVLMYAICALVEKRMTGLSGARS